MSQNIYNWYIVHVLSGYEKKVVQAIKEQAEKNNIAESFEQIIIPTEEYVEVRRGQKVVNEKKVLPGYILVKMIMNEMTWHIVKNISKVTGFLGANNKPQPVSELEINKTFQRIAENSIDKRNIINFDIGEQVKIIDGPFESFIGTVEGIDEEKSRLKISVSIFGRSTPLELEYTQVDKKRNNENF